MSESIAVFRERLRSNPSDRDSFDSLERELVRQQDVDGLQELYFAHEAAFSTSISNYWMRLLRHIDQAASREENPERRGRLFLAIGQVYEEKLGRNDQANASYQQAYRVWPRLSEALDRARAIYSEAGNWDLVLRLWEMQGRNDREPAAQATIFVEMGRVCLDKIGDGARATDFARRALTQVPGHQGAQQILDDYADLIRDWRGEVAVMLAEARELDSKEAQVQATEKVLQFVIERVPLEQAEGDPIADELCALAPEAPSSWILARTWFDRAGKAERAEEAHRQLTALLQGEERTDALREAARRAHELGLVPQEIAARRGLMRDEPHDSDNFSFLEDLATSEENPALLLEIYEDALEVGAGEKLYVLRQAATLAAQLGHLDRAEGHFLYLRDEEPNASDALEFLAARHRDREEHLELYQVLVHWAPLREGEDALQCWEEAADLAEAKLGRFEDAIEAWVKYRALHPHSPAPRAAHRRLFRHVERWGDLATLLEAEIQQDERIDEISALLHELSELYTDRLSEHEKALEHLDRLVELQPDDDTLGDRLREVARRANNVGRVRSDLLGRVEKTTAPDRYRYVEELARLELQEGSEQAAKPWLDELVLRDETDLELLRRRRDIAANEEDTDALIQLQQRLVERYGESEEGLIEILQLAEITEKSSQHEIALEAYRSAIQRAGIQNESARNGEIRALAALKRWEELVAALEKDLPFDTTPAKHERIAFIAQTQLENLELAAQHRNQALILEPTFIPARDGLLAYYAASAQWEEIERVGAKTSAEELAWDTILETYIRNIGALDGPYKESDLPEVYAQLRRLAKTPLQDPDRRLRAALLHAQQLDTRDAWQEAADTAKEAQAPEKEYKALLRAAMHADAAQEKEQGAELWTRAAALAETDPIHESDGWQERANAWRAIPPAKELRDDLARASIRTLRVAEYAALLDEHLEKVDEDTRVTFLRDLGSLFGGPLEDENFARGYWAQLLALRPRDEDALQALHTLYAPDEHPTELLKVIEARLQETNDEEERQGLELERAEVLDFFVEDAVAALEAWRVVEAHGGEAQAQAHDRMEVLLRQTQQWDALRDFFTEMLGRAQHEENAAQAMVKRGVLHLQELEEVSAGLQDLLNVLRSFSDTSAATEAGNVLHPYVTGEHSDVVDGLMEWHEAFDRRAVADSLLEERVNAHGDQERERWWTLIVRLRENRERQVDAIDYWVNYQFAHDASREQARDMMYWSRNNERSEALVTAWTSKLLAVETVPAWWNEYLMLAVETSADTDRVLEVLKRLKTLDASQSEAVQDAIEELLGSVGRTQDHIRVLVERAEKEEGAVAAERYETAGQLAEFELKDFSQAASLYQKAHAQHHEDDRHLVAYARNLLAAERWEEAVSTLRQALEDHPNSTHKAQWHAQLARASSLAGEPDATVFEELKLAATMMPSAPAVGEGLQHLAFQEGIDREIARSAASLYLSLGVGDPQLRRELHERIVVLTPDTTRRLPALLALGELLRPDVDAHRRAWEVYAEALTLAPERTGTAHLLETLAGELSEWRQTADLFAHVGTQTEGDAVEALLQRAIRIEVEENQDLERSAEHLETLLQKTGESDAQLETLQLWYDGLNLPELVLRTLDRRAELAQKTGELERYNQMRLTAVQVTDKRLQQHGASVQRWQEIVAQNPAQRVYGLQELSRLHRAESEWDALDEVLTQRVDITSDLSDRHALLRELATLREEEQEDREGAVSCLQRIVEENLEEVDALYELDRLYEKLGDLQSRYRTIQERFGRSGRVEDRFELARAGLLIDDERPQALQTLASLMLDRTELRSEALDTLRNVAAAQPDHLDVSLWRALAQVLEEESELAEAARANVAVAARVPEDALRRETLWLSVRQRLEAFADLDEAATIAVTLWREEGAQPETIGLVKECARQAPNLSLFSSAAEAVLEEEPSREWLRRELILWYSEDEVSVERKRVHLGALYDAHREDKELYRELLAMTPENERVPVLRKRLGATKEDTERQKLRSRLGLALAASEDPDERAEAQQLLEAYRQTQSADEEVNRTLRKLLADGGQWWQLASLIEEELWLTDNAQARVRLLVERAHCREKEEALPSMLVEAWFDVLAEDPAEAQAISALIRLAENLDDPILTARVQDRLELSYERSERWHELFELVKIRAVQFEDGERLDALTRAAIIADSHLQEPRLAFDAYRQVIALNPADVEAIQRASALAEELDDLESLRSALDAGLERPGIESSHRAFLRRKAALIRASQPGRAEEAIGELSTLFDAQKDWQLVEDVERVFHEDQEGFTQWLEQRANAVDDLEVRMKLLRHAADTLMTMPGHAERAGASLEAMFALRPSLKAAEELDAFYKNEGLHKARVSFWSGRLQDETPLMSLPALHAKLHETLVADKALWAEQIKQLNAWYDAIEAMRDDWSMSEHVNGATRHWKKALEDTVQRWCNSDDPAEREGDLLDALMKRAALTNYADQLFKARVAVASSEDRADRLWDDLVRQHAETISLQKAWETASEALRDAPERSARGATIEELAEQLENYEEAAALLRHITRDRFEERYELAVRAARIDIDKLQLLERATTTLQRVLNVRPDHAEARTMLRGVLDVATRRELRQRVLTTLIDTAAEPALKASLAMVGTRMAYEREDHRDALAGARTALQFDPGHLEVREFLLERRGEARWRELLIEDLLPVLRAEQANKELRLLIQSLAESETNALRKGEYAAELALLLGDDTAQGGALSAWLAALQSHPHSPSYLENAVRATTSADDAMLLRGTLETILETAHAPEVKAALLAAIGRAEIELLSDPKSGELHLLQALESNSKNENALTGLETYYLETKNYQGLANLLQARMRATEDAAQKRAHADRVITLFRGELQRPSEAAAILETLVKEGHQEESVFEALRASYQEAKDIGGEVKTLERLAARATDVDERLDLRSNALQLAMEDPALADRALALAEALLLDDHQHPEALVVRERMLRKGGDHQTLRQAQLALVEHHADDDVALEVTRQALHIQGPNLKEDGRMLGRLLAHALDRRIVREDIWASMAEWLAYIPVSEQRRLVQLALDSPSDGSTTTFYTATLYALRPSSDEVLGERVTEVLLAKETVDTAALEAVAQWFESASRPEEAILTWNRVLEASEAEARKGEIVLKIAQLEERRENFGVLMSLYEKARAYGNDSNALHAALERGFEREQRWDELLALLQTRAEHAEKEERLRLLRRLAVVSRDRFGDLVSARSYLEVAVREGGEIITRVELLEALVALHEVQEAHAMIHALSNEDLRRELRHRVELAAGLLALNEGRWEDARAWLESARTQAASHARTLLNLSQAHIGLQAWTDAQEALQAALVNQDQLSSVEKATTFVLLARVQAQDGSIERAQELVTRALRLEPELESALELAAELEAFE